MDVLKSVGQAITSLPEQFTPHRQIKKVYEQRRHMIESGGGQGLAWWQLMLSAVLHLAEKYNKLQL